MVQTFDDIMSASLPVTLAYFAVATLVATVIHETGHLLAALATRQQDIVVSIGSHATLIDRRLGDIRLRANALSAVWRPAGSVAFAGARATARDMALIAAAGPAASIVGALVTGLLFSSAGNGTLARCLAMTTAIGLFAGLGNLVPFDVRGTTRGRPGTRFESDGLQLIRALRVLYELRA